MDLPTAWNLDDKSTYLSVDSSGLRVNYEGLGKSNRDVGAIRANNPIPPYCKLFYFEVDIIDEGKNKWIGIGFCKKEVNLNGMPGWYDDDALKFRGNFNFIMGRYEEAIIDLTKLLDIEPNNKFALRYRAEAYYLMEKYKESFNDVNKLPKIDTSDEWASKLLAKIFEKE
ncbi:SPRY-domain-containing protein [Gigaspora margarita]|uniref:SPRY-domain-containing protein n=1 Tax=Gigaspora margarita TaxID=4874 RepID=A0A8H4ALG0_GIGMA|nr:SPRY-domain-containing protein [Gigaspora margarita]